MHDFCYVSKKEAAPVKAELLDIIHEVQDIVRDDFTFQFTFIGSSSRNMITYDRKSNIGFDFDVNIEVNDYDENYEPKEIRTIIRKALDKVARQYALPEITVRIDKLFCDEDKKLKAFASANIGPFAVHGIRVFENDKGMFINMPSNSYTDAQGNKQYEDVFHPVTKEGRELLVKNVLDAYKQALEQAQTNSQTQSQTSGSQTMQQM